MKLTLEQIKSIAHGAVEVVPNAQGLIHLYRLTPYQRQLFKDMAPPASTSDSNTLSLRKN